MQHKDEKTQKLIKVFGETVRKKRKEQSGLSLNLFAYGYDLNPGNLSRIENGQIEAKLTMLWRIAEALEIPLSELIKNLENQMDDDFNLVDR